MQLTIPPRGIKSSRQDTCAPYGPGVCTEGGGDTPPRVRPRHHATGDRAQGGGGPVRRGRRERRRSRGAQRRSPESGAGSKDAAALAPERPGPAPGHRHGDRDRRFEPRPGRPAVSAPSGPARSGPSPTTSPRCRQLPAPAHLPGRPIHERDGGCGAGGALAWSVRTVGTWCFPPHGAGTPGAGPCPGPAHDATAGETR